MRAIVAGALANKPGNGGEAWVRLSWIRGLEAAGAEVTFLEQVDPAACVDESGRAAEVESSFNLRFFERVVGDFGLADRAALLGPPRPSRRRTADARRGPPWRVVSGPTLDEVLDRVARADLLVNISGHLDVRGPLLDIPHRAYVDLDPGFTQFWWEAGVGDLGLDLHDTHFTVGEGIGRPGCAIPVGGLTWEPLRQPVLLEDWPSRPLPDEPPFTTVASWRGAYGPIEHAGRRYGVKVHEFRKVIDVPRRVDRPFRLAVRMHPADRDDRERLLAAGWCLLDPAEVVPDPGTFRAFVQRSGAEFSPAQGVYVDTRSGWFSDRTVRYLASGRPALVQDTGFPRHLPTGDGLLSYREPADAVARARELAANLEHHGRAARQLAEEHFEASSVCADFIDRATRGSRSLAGAVP